MKEYDNKSTIGKNGSISIKNAPLEKLFNTNAYKTYKNKQITVFKEPVL